MIISLPNAAYGQSKSATASLTPKSPTATVDPQDEDLIKKIKQIEILKEKIATKVAEIRDKEKGAFLGTVKSVDENTVVLTTAEGESSFTYSEDTLFFQITDNLKKEWTDAKLKTGDYISVFGYYNESRELFSAKFIFLQEKLIRLSGKVADVDKSNFTLQIKARDGEKVIDFEKYTVTSLLVKGKSQKSGFSKFAVGDSVYIVGTANAKEDDRFAAQRILHFPINLSPTPEKAESTPKTSPTIKPS